MRMLNEGSNEETLVLCTKGSEASSWWYFEYPYVGGRLKRSMMELLGSTSPQLFIQ